MGTVFAWILALAILFLIDAKTAFEILFAILSAIASLFKGKKR